MGWPGLDTVSRACRSVFCRVRVMVPAAAPYLMALSSSTETTCRSLSRSPRTSTSSAMWYSSVFPASKATGSKARAQSSAAVERLISDRTAVCTALSARARVSISSTRDLIRWASEWMLSAQRAGLSVSGEASSSSALERMTVRGVFSSWEASDKNWRCWRQARSTGAVAQRDSTTAAPSSSKSAPRAMSRYAPMSRRSMAISMDISTNAIFW